MELRINCINPQTSAPILHKHLVPRKSYKDTIEKYKRKTKE